MGKNSLNKMPDISFLPSLVISKILSSLSPRDMKSAVLVCRLWRKVGESSSLWSWARVKICPSDMGDILNSGRLQIVRKVYLVEWSDSDSEQVELLLQALARLPSLRIISFGDLPLSGVEESILSCLVNKMEEIKICGDMSESVETVLSVIRQDTQLRRMSCNHNDLSSIQTGTLATAVNRLVHVQMFATHLTTAQLSAILVKIDETSKLKFLNIGYNDLSSVEPDILATAVNKMEKVWMFHSLTTVQVTCMLRQAVKNTKLKKLDCRRNTRKIRYCDDVDPELVREVEQKIGELIY